MNREELIALVARVRAADSEEESERLLEELERAVPHPEVSDLVFWQEPELSDEQVVDRALAYRPIVL